MRERTLIYLTHMDHLVVKCHQGQLKLRIKEYQRLFQLFSGSTSSTRGPYTKLTPAQRLTIGKRAAELGTTAVMKYFAKKYSGEFGFLKETTVRNLYEAELRFSDLKAENLKELPLKKTGQPLMLGDELDKQDREYVRDLQAMGVTINTAVVLASAEGIIIHKDANLLQSIELTEGWAKYQLHRISFVKRKGTTKAKMSIEHFEEVKKRYQACKFHG